MKKLATIILSSILTLHLAAQFPGGGSGQTRKAPPSIGHIYGKVVDSADKPIGEASIVLLQNKFDSSSKKMKQILFTGATTKPSGEFDFANLPLFGITMKISAVGYKSFEEKIAFQMKAPAAGTSTDPSKQMQQAMNMMGALDKDMGNIKLSPDVNQLQNVTVSASVSSLKMDIDKKTFNVDKNIVSSGGTALDVMKNVPSVQVDIDGNVKLRNATPQIYIDGRPTTLTLDQIPADAIQSVEVITNPSAKYDASGGNAGILNIVLKKNKKTGYNGNLMAGVDSRGGVNGGGNFSVRQGKFNLSLATMINQRKDRTVNNITSTTSLNNKITNATQNTISKNNGEFMFGRLGIDYFVSNRTTISLSGIKVHGQFKPFSTSDISTDSIIDGVTTNYASQRFTNSSRTFNATGSQFGMVHNFPKDGEQLTADGNYFAGKNSGYSYYTNKGFDGLGNPVTGVQQQLSNGTNKFFTIQTDYTDPFAKNSKFETGLRAQINKLNNDNSLSNQNEDGSYTKVASQSINYHNTNSVYAAYATITSSIKNFGYEIGLRAESSQYSGVLNDTQKFTHNYPISLFPSIFLSQKLGGKQELQANFSRRINRPNFFQLIPFTDRTDSLQITRGNPDLVPEFTNSFELSYSVTYGKKNNSFLASAYYKHTHNLITRYQDSEYNTDSKKYELIYTYVNANSSYSYGAEFTTVDYISKWWDLTANVNLYNSKINTSNITVAASQPSIFSYFGKLNNNFKLPSNFTIQLSGNYQSKTNLPVNSGGQQFGPPQAAQSSSQGYIKPFWFTDIAIKKTFLKNQAAAVTLSFSDIFRTRKNEQISESPIFYQDYYRLNNPQLVRINFSYRFGKMDVSLFKRQSKNSGQGVQEGMQMGGTR